MRRGPIIHIVIGAIWLILGVLAVVYNMKLMLFFRIPISNYLVIAIGVIWTGAATYTLIHVNQQQKGTYPQGQTPGQTNPYSGQ